MADRQPTAFPSRFAFLLAQPISARTRKLHTFDIFKWESCLFAMIDEMIPHVHSIFANPRAEKSAREAQPVTGFNTR